MNSSPCAPGEDVLRRASCGAAVGAALGRRRWRSGILSSAAVSAVRGSGRESSGKPSSAGGAGRVWERVGIAASSCLGGAVRWIFGGIKLSAAPPHAFWRPRLDVGAFFAIGSGSVCVGTEGAVGGGLRRSFAFFQAGQEREMAGWLPPQLQQNGVLSGAPFLCSYVSSVFFCYFADLLVTKNYLTLTNVRKLFTALSQVVPGLLVLLIGYLGCDIVLVVVIWFIAVTLITASYAGAMASIVDIAPNLAGPILAFAQTIHMTASFLSPLVAGVLTQEQKGLEQWRKVFGVTAGVAVATYVVFQIFGTADIQKWNYPDEVPPARETLTKRMIPIISNKIHDADEEVATIPEEEQSLHSPDNKRDIEGA